MIAFGGIIYQLDLNAFDKAVKKNDRKNDGNNITVTKTCYNEMNVVVSIEVTKTENKFELEPEVDMLRFDMLRNLIDIVLDDAEDEPDDTMGADRALEKMPLSFRIAFNTLKKYNIIIESEE